MRGHPKDHCEMVTLLSHMAFPGFKVQFGATLFHSPCVCQDRKHSLLGFLQTGWMVSGTQNPTREQKGKLQWT